MLASRRLLIERCRSGKCLIAAASKRIKSTVAEASASAAALESASRPTNKQLWRVFARAAVPMIGFGFTDQTVMLQAGNAIDCTLGVTFGLSTLTAAAFGQICSDAAGVVFGGTVERLATRAGLPSANLTAAQRVLPVVGQVRWAGTLMGVIFGCILGLGNLFFIDTGRSSTLKLQAFNEEQEFEFEIEASNAIRDNVTSLKITGPDVDGLLASMTAALAFQGCSVVEINAKRQHESDAVNTLIEDVFYVVKRDTQEPFEDDELEELAQGLLESTRTPMNVNNVKAAMHELKTTNSYLRARVKKLEKTMYERNVKLVSSSGEERGLH